MHILPVSAIIIIVAVEPGNTKPVQHNLRLATCVIAMSCPRSSSPAAAAAVVAAAAAAVVAAAAALDFGQFDQCFLPVTARVTDTR